MKKILIIEDNGQVVGGYMEAEQLQGHEVVYAGFLSEAAVEIKKGGWDVVVLDACLEGQSPDTLHLIPLISEVCPAAILIANSSTHNALLVESGCPEESACLDKRFLPRTIARHLK